MDLPLPLAWLVDEAAGIPTPDAFLAALGGKLLTDGIPLTGGALTIAVPHPIIASRSWMWRAETGAVVEALGFAGTATGQAVHNWLSPLGPIHEERLGQGQTSYLGWAGKRA